MGDFVVQTGAVDGYFLEQTRAGDVELRRADTMSYQVLRYVDTAYRRIGGQGVRYGRSTNLKIVLRLWIGAFVVQTRRTA